jgi:hypothetical protein
MNYLRIYTIENKKQNTFCNLVAMNILLTIRQCNLILIYYSQDVARLKPESHILELMYFNTLQLIATRLDLKLKNTADKGKKRIHLQLTISQSYALYYLLSLYCVQDCELSKIMNIIEKALPEHNSVYVIR